VVQNQWVGRPYALKKKGENFIGNNVFPVTQKKFQKVGKIQPQPLTGDFYCCSAHQRADHKKKISKLQDE